MQVATGILAAVFFGCRPCSLFDTRVKFDDSDDSDEGPDAMAVASASNGRKDSHKDKVDGGHHMKTKRDCDVVMAIDLRLLVTILTSQSAESERKRWKFPL